MKVNGRSVFCMDLGNTCHNGDAYKSSSKTYSTADGGTSKQMASLAYWFDKTMKRSNRAYIMTQALVWSIENGGTSQAKLKDVIKAVKNNTGKFTSSVDNLYSQIFQPSEDIKAESTIWQYGGSGSKRQRLVDLKASTQPGESEPQEAHIHDTITYHQRINIFKVNDEDKPLKGAKFKIVADNIDELYSFTAYGKSNETGSMDDIGDHFEIAAETDADGMIVMRFTYKLQSENYYYAKNADSLTSEQKTALKKEWNREGYKYASDLSKEGAKTLMQTELDKEWQKIANKYTITEISSGSNNILVAPTYKNGKTLTLKTRDSWTAINGVWPESTLKEMWKYSQAVNERVTNTRKKASVRVIKQDADSKDGKARGEAALDGAIFKLYEDSKCTQRAEVTDASGKTTNGIYVVKNGQFDTDYMICGKDYWLKEEKAPKKAYIQYEEKMVNGRMCKQPILDQNGKPVVKREYKGTFKPKSIEACRREVVNEIIREKENNLKINSIIRDSIVKQKREHPLAKDKELCSLFLKLYRDMPDCNRNMWNYNNPIMNPQKKQIDAISQKYIEKYHGAEYQEFLSLINAQAEKYKKAYGESSDRNYTEGKLNDLYTRMGNAVLTEIRAFDKQQDIKTAREWLNRVSQQGDGSNLNHKQMRVSQVRWGVNLTTTLSNLKKGLKSEWEKTQLEREHDQIVENAIE